MRFVPHILATLVLVCFKGPAPAQEPPQLELTLQTGHTSPVTSVALNGDGKYLVSCSGDSTALLWEAATGKILRALQGHTGPVTGVAISGDGKLVVTGSLDRTAIVWEAETGKKIHTLRDRDMDMTRAVAISGDGKRILTASAASGRPNALLWDAANGARLGSIPGYFSRLSLSNDGKFAVIGSASSVTQYHPEPLRKGSTLTGSIAAVSHDGKIGVNCNPGVTVWEIARGKYKVLHTLKEITSQVTDLVLNEDGKHLVIGSADGTATLWETATGKKLQSFQLDPLKSVGTISVVLSGDGKRLATTHRNSRYPTTVWEVDSGKKIRDFHSQGHLSPVMSLAVSGDGKSLVSGMGDGMAHLWMPADGKKALTVQAVNFRVADPEVNKVCSVGLTNDGKRLATVSDRGRYLKVWHTADGTKSRDQRVGRVFERQPILCVRLFDDGKRIKVGAATSLWEIDSDAGLQRFVGHKRPVTSIALSRDEKHLVTGSQDKTAILWDVSLTRQIRTFDGHAAAVTSVALSDDGKLVLTGTDDNLAVLWDAANGQKVRTFAGHTGAVTGLALSDDGKYLWTASLDSTTRLWDRATGKERCCLYSLDEGKDWLVVTPEGYFDGSPGAWKFVTYRVPGTLKLVDDDATRKKFHRPGLLAELWKGK